MKTCSTSLPIKEMQIKTTLRSYLAPVTMTCIKKTKQTTAGGMTQAEKHLPYKHEALSSNPNLTNKNKKKTRNTDKDAGEKKEPSYIVGGNIN
jgi:hypothetical protein